MCSSQLLYPIPRLVPPAAPPTWGWVGTFLHSTLTLCRRSPAPGMGAAAAVGPWAGFRARVGERGEPPAPRTLGTHGRGMVATFASLAW
jgi:hypothetical protein